MKGLLKPKGWLSWLSWFPGIVFVAKDYLWEIGTTWSANSFKFKENGFWILWPHTMEVGKKRWRDFLHMHADISILNGESKKILFIFIISIYLFYLLYHLFFFYLQKWMVMWLLLYHMIKWRGGGLVLEIFCFCFYDWMKTLIPWNFMILKWNMSNDFLIFFCRK